MFLILAFLPTQLGKHFWPEFSIVQGLRIDYLSPTIYVTDALIGALLVGYLIRTRVEELVIFLRRHQLALLLLCIVVLLSTLNAQRIENSLQGSLKLLEMLFFGYYVANVTWSRAKRVLAVSVIAAGIYFESLLALWQFANQGSIGGALYFLGERSFSAQTPGIANASLNGQLILRPYATFPHPNVLAGYLLLGMLLLLPFLTERGWRIRLSVLGSLLLGSLGLLLTMSRVALVLWVFFAGFWGILQQHRLKMLLVLGVLVVGILSVGLSSLRYRFADFLASESVTQRTMLVSQAVSMSADNVVTGVGIQNFLIVLPQYQELPVSFLQPVHNIYLLVLAETGIPGISLFIWFTLKTVRHLTRQKTGRVAVLFPLLIVLLLGVFDHYLLTVQQGQLLFALVLGLSWSSKPHLWT